MHFFPIVHSGPGVVFCFSIHYYFVTVKIGMTGYHFFTLLFALAALFTMPAVGLAKQSSIQIKPTIAFDTKARVMRGGEVEITLNAVSNYGNSIDFEIRTPPMHGTLGVTKNISDHSAVVTYHHDGTKSPKDDVFTFRAKTLGRAASAVSEVSIQIIPPAPQITFSAKSLDFGEVLLSETRDTNITITNIGGVRATGRLLLPKGFTAPDADRFSLDEGESAVLVLQYIPMEEGASSGVVTTLPVLGEEGATLKGVGVPRFEITNRGPVEWEISNKSGQPIRVNFSCVNSGQDWQMPKETLIEAHGGKIVTFQQIEPAELAELAGGASKPVTDRSPTVLVTDGLSSKEIQLPPPRRFVPLMVQGITPEKLPNASLGSSVPVAFRLHNRTEFPKLAHWSAVSQSGGGTSTNNALELRPGEMKEVSFDWSPSLPGDAVLKVIVDEGASSPHELLWKMHVLSGSPSASGTSAGISSAAPSPEVSPEELPTAPPPSSEGKMIPGVEDVAWNIQFSWLGKHSVVIEWKDQEKVSPRVVLNEMCLVRSVEVDAPQPTDETSKLPAVKLEAFPLIGYLQSKNGDHQRITISKLSPGWHLLTLSLFADGDSVPASSSQLQVKVPAKVPWWVLWKVPMGISAIFFLVLFLRNQRRAT